MSISKPVSKAVKRAASASRVRRSKTQTVSGSLLQFVFSPKGGVEGLLLEGTDAPVQITIPVSRGHALTQALHVGGIVTAQVSTKNARVGKKLHPVFRAISLSNGDAAPLAAGARSKKLSTVEGTVARLNFARDGAPNGVVLENGHFVHIKPAQMKRSKLIVGDEVRAEGTTRLHVLGGVALEAQSINGKKLAKK